MVVTRHPTADNPAAQKKTCKSALCRRVWQSSKRALCLHHSPANQFALCEWQKSTRPTILYIIYRWLLFLTLLSVAIASFAFQALPKHYNGPLNLTYYKWFVFFTNWGFMLLILQSALALAVVHRFRAERNINSVLYIEQDDTCVRRYRTPIICRVYWLSHSVATDLALVITLIYWTLVHDPEIHELNALNVLVHGANTFVVILEIIMTSHPFHFVHSLYGAAAGICYGVFSAIYWAAGGTDRIGNPTLYAALDWRKPGSALGFVAVCACVLCFAHAFATILALLRSKIAQRWKSSKKTSDSVHHSVTLQ